jgi:hypothetical protein
MSTTINDGGPAFPTTLYDENIKLSDVGMTLRDYFAAQALSNRAGMLKNGVMYASDVATECYYIADAMLTAREASK